MAQRIALGFILDKILKEATVNINQSQRDKIESEVDKKLIGVLGSDWSKLPVTGPRMMALVFILNIVLVPFGIVPATLIEIAISKSREYRIDKTFDRILLNSKLSSPESKEKMQDIIDYAGEAGNNVKEALLKISDETGSTISKFLKKGKGIFGKIIP